MAAYVIVQVNVTDPEKFKGYQALVPGTLEKFGGRVIARAADFVALEGEWPPARTVMIEFPSLADAQGWYGSPAYAEAIEARRGAATLNMIAIEGV